MKNNSAARSIYVIGALFFVFGFVTWINSVLIPFLKQICELTDFQAYFVTFAFYISYFVMAIPSSWVLRRSGFVRGMSYGLLAMAVGSILFIPAALDRSYALFLLGLFLQGTGLALLQTASNPYVTILGPIESAAQRISIMGVCNKIAGMTGIFLLSRFLFSDIEGISAKIAGLTGADKIAELHVLAEKIIVPYVCITVVLILLALVIRFAAKLPEIDVELNCEEAGHERRSLLDYPYFWLGAVSLFLYVGAEVVAIDTLPLYGESQGLSGDVATKLGICSLVATTYRARSEIRAPAQGVHRMPDARAAVSGRSAAHVGYYVDRFHRADELRAFADVAEPVAAGHREFGQVYPARFGYPDYGYRRRGHHADALRGMGRRDRQPSPAVPDSRSGVSVYDLFRCSRL